ncbi:hypothetical protein [Caballeronia telluris]|uniref:Uncharacterized protein n=1 Tax=Caballeronia telluris TaxID=326475 RepID=A0A158F289_9BURK|nr:hypothetical protein [Caballeronia telluris]SAL13912.1 hypothetical protein AWB66_00507 [Caballeronia telluris]
MNPPSARPPGSRFAIRHTSSHWLSLLYGLLGAPLAWIVQICVCEALAAQTCYPLQTPLARPVVPSLAPLIGGVSAVCLAVAFGGFATAWGNLRATQREAKLASARTAQPIQGPMRFLALVGVIASSIFVLGVLATAAAALIVSPCKPW